MDQRDIIRSKAKELGFPFCGFARVDGLGEHRDFYTGFMSRKDYPGMNYLVTTFEKRMEPRKILPEAKTVIGLLQNYYPGETLPEKDRFIVARYAYGKNYRDVIKKKLKELAVSLLTLDPGMKIRYFVDSGPMMEKVWAQKCGLGWQGKNTLLINPKAGSFYFIAILLTSLELEPDKPETDHCGNCDLCVRACPTGALNKPYRLDIPRCIAYLNIVLKTGIPEEFKPKMNDRLFGCEICQDVCPYNRFSKPHDEPDYRTIPFLVKAGKSDWMNLSEKEFREIFRENSIIDTGYEKIRGTAVWLS